MYMFHDALVSFAERWVIYMKLKIAFLQLVPDVNIEDNIENGIKACREAKAMVGAKFHFIRQ